MGRKPDKTYPPRIACIYRIVNTVTGETYVGSTNNWLTRKAQHLTALRSGEHCNEKLQESFRRYGEASFLIEVLERSPFDSLWRFGKRDRAARLYDLIILSWLNEREGHYYRELKASLNVKLPPRSFCPI